MSYSINQAASIIGLSAHTLRYYDKEGLLPFLERDESGFRDFKDSDIEWLEIIECLKQSGMTIKEMKAFADLHLMGDSTLQQRYNLFLDRKKQLLEQMNELQSALDKNDFQCWYFEKALEAGTLNVHKESPGHRPPEYAAR